MAELTIKLKASSLLEVMVALVVMFTVFSISMGLYVNVISASSGMQKTKAMSELEKWAFETKNNLELIDGKIEKDGYIFEKSVKPVAGSTNAIILEFKAFNSDNKIIAVRREIITTDK